MTRGTLDSNAWADERSSRVAIVARLRARVAWILLVASTLAVVPGVASAQLRGDAIELSPRAEARLRATPSGSLSVQDCAEITSLTGGPCTVRPVGSRGSELVEIRMDYEGLDGGRLELPMIADLRGRSIVVLESRLVGVAIDERAVVIEDPTGLRAYSFVRRRWEYLETCWLASMLGSSKVACVDPSLSVRVVALDGDHASKIVFQGRGDRALGLDYGAVADNVQRGIALRVRTSGSRRSASVSFSTSRAECVRRPGGEDEARCIVETTLRATWAIEDEGASPASSATPISCELPLSARSSSGPVALVPPSRERLDASACAPLGSASATSTCRSQTSPDGRLRLLYWCAPGYEPDDRGLCLDDSGRTRVLLTRIDGSSSATTLVDLSIHFWIHGLLPGSDQIVITTRGGTWLLPWGSEAWTYVGPCFVPAIVGPSELACLDVSGALRTFSADRGSRLVRRGTDPGIVIPAISAGPKGVEGEPASLELVAPRRGLADVQWGVSHPRFPAETLVRSVRCEGGALAD